MLSRCVSSVRNKAFLPLVLRGSRIREVKISSTHPKSLLVCGLQTPTMGSSMSSDTTSKPPSTAEVKFSEGELRDRLTPMQYHVTQEKGTERAFTGELTYNKDSGMYSCVVCGHPLFKSDHKFDSGSGWPSFYEVMNLGAVETHTDLSHGMKRVEVTCKKCGSHLGHVFDDGPQPTGQRYCINSASLKFDANTPKSEL